LQKEPTGTTEFKVTLAAAVGWGLSGMISYGMVVGYGRANDFFNVYYGLMMLFADCFMDFWVADFRARLAGIKEFKVLGFPYCGNASLWVVNVRILNQ
jgi:hypothetical protein